MAVFQQQEGTAFHGRKKQLPAAGKNETAMVQPWVKPGAGLYYFSQQEHVLAIPEQWQEDIALLQKQLYLRKAGVNIGAVKGKDLVPAHELALSLLLHPDLTRVTVDLENAQQYLRRKDITVNSPAKGWARIHEDSGKIGAGPAPQGRETGKVTPKRRAIGIEGFPHRAGSLGNEVRPRSRLRSPRAGWRG